MLRTEFEGPEEHKATFDQYSVLITKQVLTDLKKKKFYFILI
jgi:hypothetical protein